MLSRTSTSAVVPRSTGEFSDFLGRSALEPVKQARRLVVVVVVVVVVSSSSISWVIYNNKPLLALLHLEISEGASKGGIL